MKNIITRYITYITEAGKPKSEEGEVGDDYTTPRDNASEVEANATFKVKKAMMYININMGFYAEVLSHVSIFGSYDSQTMWTNCQTYIAFNPNFVNEQPDEVVRFTLMHEILHVLGQHHDRENGRDHQLWGYSADFAINPIIMSEQKFKEGFIKRMKLRDGSDGFLYEERFDGLRAEDIYDILVSEGKTKLTDKEKEAAMSGDFSGKESKAVPGTEVQTRIEDEYVDPDGDEYEEEEEDPSGGSGGSEPTEGEEGKEGQGIGEEGDEGDEGEDGNQPGKGQPGDNEGDGDGKLGKDGKPINVKFGPNGKPINVKLDPNGQPIELDADGTPMAPMFHKEVRPNKLPDGEKAGSIKVKRNIEVGDVLKGKTQDYVKTTGSKILRRKTPKKTNWSSIKSEAMARNAGSMSDKTKNLLSKSIGDKPIVNWEQHLKKFFDFALTGNKVVLPNKRLLASGIVTYGNKKIGTSSLKTIVAAVDTSGSISEDQKMTFLNEVIYLSKQYNADKMIIIYCSDDIDGIDIVPRGKTLDYNKMKSTGGNAKGFTPPFEYLYDHHITPSVFIYLTDTGGLMPDKEKNNITKYMNKVIWFVCSANVDNPPPFGKTIFMPVASIKGANKERRKGLRL